jgi:hypothetical protein
MILITAALLAAAPAFAQTAAPPPVVQVTTAPVDPARLAAAKPVIEQIWPLGTYARIMRATMDQVVNGTMAGMYDMKPGDFAPAAKGEASAKSPPGGDKTMGQILAEEDPAFQERMRITMRVITDGITDLMTEVEPQVREALAIAYARKFDAGQLADLHRFFDTPTGRIYAADSMTLMASPDMMKAMQAFVPRMVQAMPGIMAKVQDATKGLPPVRKKAAPR